LHRKSEASEHLQYELITIGGDDVLLVVPAKYAFDVAVSMMQTFENDPYDLSLSVGIAFGRFNTPVRVLRDMAAYLLKEGAKQRKHECGSQHGYLDFHDLVREGYFSESVRDHRQINSQKTEEPIFLTSRPYTLQEFEKLRQFSQKLDRALSKSMLVALSAEVEIEGRNSDRGQERSKLYFLYQYSRLGKEGDRKNVSEALAEFQPEVESTSDLDFITDWIWQARTCNETTQLVTPVQDIVMLIDLQGRGRDADYIRD
jgi:hypothetical protein